MEEGIGRLLSETGASGESVRGAGGDSCAGTPAPGHPQLLSGLSFFVYEAVGWTVSVPAVLAGRRLHTGLPPQEHPIHAVLPAWAQAVSTSLPGPRM